MSIAHAIFQGIIQGLTEFLPVSSSGHLSLVQYFTGQGTDYGIFFTVLLHIGTLAAVVIAFWGTIIELAAEFFRMILDIFRGRFSLREASPPRRMILLMMLSLLPLGFTFFVRDFFTGLATDDSLFAEGFSFLGTSALLFLSDKCAKGRKTAADMKGIDALLIGGVQAVSPLPGLSRSGSTISVGLMLGLDRKYAVAFSFIMGIPAVLAASLLEVGGAFRQGITMPVPAMVAGLVASIVFGLLAIKLVAYFVASDRFKYFGWYTLVLGIAVLVAAVIELSTGGMLRELLS